MHSWEPLVTQQQSQFQKWLKAEQSRIQAYNGPMQKEARTGDSGHRGGEGRRQSLKPINFQLPKSVTKGLSVVDRLLTSLLTCSHASRDASHSRRGLPLAV